MTRPYHCPVCGGIIPGFYLVEKEVMEQEVLPGIPTCTCGRGEVIRQTMGRVFRASRVAARAVFYDQARRLGLRVE